MRKSLVQRAMESGEILVQTKAEKLSYPKVRQMDVSSLSFVGVNISNHPIFTFNYRMPTKKIVVRWEQGGRFREIEKRYFWRLRAENILRQAYQKIRGH